MHRFVLAALIAAVNPVLSCAAPALPIPATRPPVILANGDPAMSDTLTGRWTVTDMTGAAVPAGIAVRMEFGEGSVAGTSGCNSFSARLTLNGQTLAIGPARSTRKACNGDAMAVERAFLRALGQIDRYAIASDGTLELSDGSGVLIRARRE